MSKIKNLCKEIISAFCNNIIIKSSNKRGDFYISDAVRIIAAVILGALLLAAIVLIFNQTVIPRITSEIEGLFS